MEKNSALILTKATVDDLSRVKVKENMPDDLSVTELLDLIKENAHMWQELQTYYRCAMMEVETKFRVLDQELSLKYDENTIETIKTRMKSLESLAEKMLRKRLPMNIHSVEENIFDMAGVRVICSFPEDIYALAESFLNQDDIFLIAKKDYIKSPKKSGYRALHLVVDVPIFLHDEKRMMKVEVQLRTIAMDFWASLEHKLRYKKHLDPDMLEELGDRLYRCSEDVSRLDIEMQKIKNKIDRKV